jgi:type IV pilus assembly protein PilM
MSLFKKKANFLGFDLSKKSIKIVELEHKGEKPTLVTYGGMEISSFSLDSATPRVMQELVQAINNTLTKARVSTRDVVASLPPQNVFNSVLQVPKVSDRELPEAVKWEAKQNIPAPLEDVIIDWQKVGEDQKTKKLEIYVIAAPKNLVQKYLEIYKLAGLNPLALEIDPLALVRSLVRSYNASISVVERGVLRFCRTVNSGGETITKAIASNLNVDTVRAEQFKKDFGINTEKLEGQILKSIQPIINTILTEIKRSIEFYKTEGREEIKKIILSGGGAQLPELTTYLTKHLNIETKLGNPWANVSYPEKLTPHLNEIGPAFSVAIGLAMRHHETY